MPPATSNVAAKKKIRKMTQIEHVLHRPDMYIGSIDTREYEVFLHTTDMRMEKKVIALSSGFYKIFDEVIVNACDQASIGKTSVIKVEVDRESFSVYNNSNIDIERQDGVYIPELVFGHMLTSTNYDDSEERFTGGRNGLGVKLANIFSNKTLIEVCDGVRLYKQKFEKNMSVIDQPTIREIKGNKKPYTKVTIYPDFTRFGMRCIDDDLMRLFMRRAVDISAIHTKVSVYFNRAKIQIRTFKQYAQMFYKEGEEVAVFENEYWKVCCGLNNDGVFEQQSFVNGVNTTHGGTHVSHISDQVCKYILQKMKKNVSVKASEIKRHLFACVDVKTANPTFDSQLKETLTLPASKFSSPCVLPDKFLNKVSSSSFGLVDRLKRFVSIKQEKELAKNDGVKKKTVFVPKLDDAKWAGTSRSGDCALILTEGDSAKTLAIAGLTIVGRNAFGVFPLKGKLLNTRSCSSKQLAENEEIMNIKKILGLKHNVDYTKHKGDLRYGKVIIMTDADVDGSHIKGLLINFFETQHPSLLQIPGFLEEFKTPLLKAKWNTHTYSFFNQREFENWAKGKNNVVVKYYKGLGTSTSKEAKEYFSNMQKHIGVFEYDAEASDALSLAFDKKKTNERKQWLATAPDEEMETKVKRISKFIHADLKMFSIADLKRSIPHVMDGLKPSQRKVLFTMLRNGDNREVKVAQLCGLVAQKTMYHHGEVSLSQCIVQMAQDFTGSNNINFLEPCGQFGTRLMNGKDCASSRYIFTKLSDRTRKIFMKSDDDVLSYLEDDGVMIEPEFYAPIIPTVLVNGGEGIGTGWSTSVPQYNPAEISEYIKRKILGENVPGYELTPWYKGFEGVIEKSGNGFISKGVYTLTENNTIHISEIPIGMSIERVKQHLEKLVQTGIIQKFENSSSEERVKFTVFGYSGSNLEKDLNMCTAISTTNMVLFDPRGQIKHYNSVGEIIDDFFTERLRIYEARRASLLERLSEKYSELLNKSLFVEQIVHGKLIIFMKKTREISDMLDVNGFEKKSGSFDYLLRMNVSAFTEENVVSLNAQKMALKHEIDKLRTMTVNQMWLRDLESLI